MVCGIVAEYNPFHNGHKYQLDLIKKTYDTVVVVMSGSFTQRGDVAIIDKWSRTEAAIRGGADLVIELPAVYAMNTAERFACGAVNILNSLNCIDAISFGSECGDIQAITSAANALLNETDEQKRQIKKLMDEGYSYAVSREKVFEGIIPSELLKNPNNILGIEYVKQLILLDSNIEPITHKRQGAHYSSCSLEDNLSSASAIRNNAESEHITGQMPDDAYEIFKASPKHYLRNLDHAAIYHIRRFGKDALRNTFECVEGLENRIYECALRNSTIEKIAEDCSTKRYTKAKIRRIILSSMLGIDKSLCKEPVSYARVLGASENGCKLLAEIKEKSSLTVVTKTADYKENNEMFDKDILATDIWALSSQCQEETYGAMDFVKSPYIRKE